MYLRDNMVNQNAYEYAFEAIDGKKVCLSDFKGSVIMVVNTATRCGLRYQFRGLQKLWDQYRAQNFMLIGVPSNDFGNQEPGNESDITSFCETNYNVDFLLTAKVRVIGANAHPFYKWANSETSFLQKPRWNFHKYLVSSTGTLVGSFSSVRAPQSSRVIRAIDQYLRDR